LTYMRLPSMRSGFGGLMIFNVRLPNYSTSASGG